MRESTVALDEIIQGSKKALEVKRALSVKLFLQSMPVVEICSLLQVSQPFVSKWHGIYQAQGASHLALGYAGSQGFLSPEQQAQVMLWMQGQDTLEISDVRDYLQEHHGVSYKSQQSYYELMRQAGLSYHKSEKVNPKRDEKQVQERREEIKKNWVNTGRR